MQRPPLCGCKIYFYLNGGLIDVKGLTLRFSIKPRMSSSFCMSVMLPFDRSAQGLTNPPTSVYSDVSLNICQSGTSTTSAVITN